MDIAWAQKGEFIQRTVSGNPVVAFLTCGREDLTIRTLKSFQNLNENWEKFYADDASNDQLGMRKIVESFGFHPLVLNDHRIGCSKTTDLLAQAVLKTVGENRLVLYLQNDFELLRPIPLGPIRSLLKSGIGWVWLGDWHKGEAFLRNERIDGELFEIGKSDFVYNPPLIAMSQTFARILDGATSENDVVMRSRTLNLQAASFLNNIAVHTGGQFCNGHGTRATPGGIFK